MLRMKIPGLIHRLLTNRVDFIRSRWEKSGCPSPAPHPVKLAVLDRYSFPGGTWIESGTFMGDTTAHLATQSQKVISIEPERHYAELATQRFRGNEKVAIICARSQDVIEGLLENVEGPVNLWLDGHWSQGETFKDESDTPIMYELESISNLLGIERRVKFAVFVDDVRLFASQHKEDPTDMTRQGYPELKFLVEWAAKHNLSWTIELDIFVARSVSF